MNSRIYGLGAWIPEKVRNNSEWPADFGKNSTVEDRELTNVVAGTNHDLCDRVVQRYVKSEHGDPFFGSKNRRIADDDMSSVESEIFAGQAAIEVAGIDPKDIGLVLSWAVVPDRITPPSAPPVATALGATKALAMGMDCACASALIQIDMAQAMIAAGKIKYALLTQSHLMTRTFPMSHPASPNIGDIATAIVVGPSDDYRQIIKTHAVSEGQYYDAVAWRKSKQNDTRWFEPGGASYLGSYSPNDTKELIQNTVRIATNTITELLDDCRMHAEEIDVIASVQPRKWIPRAIAEVLRLDPSIAPDTFEEYAHLGGCGPVINLMYASKLGLLKSNSLVCMYGQGAGFTRAATLIRM